MIDTQITTFTDREPGVTRVSGPSDQPPTEPSEIDQVRWRRRVAEQLVDVPYSTPAEDPYAKVDEKKRATSLMTESDDALTEDNAATQRLMLSLPAIKGEVNGRGGPLHLNEDSFVGNPPEETRLMAVIYKEQRFGHEDVHHELKPADFVAINAILVLANTNRDGKLSWSKDGLASKAMDIRGREKSDPVAIVKNAVDAHIAERKEKFARSFDPKDILTMRGYDACVATALGSGDLMSALKLLEGVGRLFPEDATATADASSRHLPSIRKAYEMYPTELKQQADAIFASLTAGEFQNLLGVDAMVRLHEESIRRLEAVAVFTRDRWYGAQQACGTPEQLRKRLKHDKHIEEALSKDTDWESMVRGLETETNDIVEAQVANLIARELARRVHPGRTIQAHVQTEIQRAMIDARYDGPSFDPQHGSHNEYVPVYGVNPADNVPDPFNPRKISALSLEQQKIYFTKPDQLDVAAFISFFRSPSGFVGREQVSAAAASAMADRFVPAMQFLSALVYSGPKGYKNNEVQELIKRQFGITVDASTTDTAHLALKNMAPTHWVANFGGELMSERNPSLLEDQNTLIEIQALVPKAKAAELALATEDLRHAIRSKMGAVDASQAEAQKYLDDIAKAQQNENQAKEDQERLTQELEDAKSAKVGKGVMGFGKGKFPTADEQKQHIAHIEERIRQAKERFSASKSELIRLRGFQDQSDEKRRIIERCKRKMDKLSGLLDEAIPRR